MSLIGYLKEWQEAERRKSDELKKRERDKAIDDSKKAGTDDEIWKNQDTIVNNQPKP